MNIHESRAVSLTNAAASLAPVFVPLIEVDAGTTVLPSQCTLTITGGVPSPYQVAVMLCAPGTLQGDPGTAVLAQSDVCDVMDGVPFALRGSIPPLAQGGVLGLSVPAQPLPAGATVQGTISLVR